MGVLRSLSARLYLVCVEMERFIGNLASTAHDLLQKCAKSGRAVACFESRSGNGKLESWAGRAKTETTCLYGRRAETILLDEIGWIGI